MGMMLQRPFHAGQDAGQRPQPPALALGGALDVGRIGNHRHAQPREGGIGIVGDDHEVHDLRPQPLDDMRHHRLAAQQAQRLRHALAHAPALAARQDDADQGAGPDRRKGTARVDHHGPHYAKR